LVTLLRAENVLYRSFSSGHGKILLDGSNDDLAADAGDRRPLD
jgi:hypothetical protein